MAMVMALAVLSVAGCSLLGPWAAPSEPFGDFSLGEFGGIDGRQNIVYVRADGVALLVSRMPAAGRLSGHDLSRLKTLLTSRQFRQEVKGEVERKAKSPAPVCADQITTEVTMGSLWMSRTAPCGTEAAPTPAFDEIVSILTPAMRGTSTDRSRPPSRNCFLCGSSGCSFKINRPIRSPSAPLDGP